MAPEFSYHFDIHPWQYADLTFGEIEEYLDALAKIRAANKKAGGRG